MITFMLDNPKIWIILILCFLGSEVLGRSAALMDDLCKRFPDFSSCVKKSGSKVDSFGKPEIVPTVPPNEPEATTAPKGKATEPDMKPTGSSKITEQPNNGPPNNGPPNNGPPNNGPPNNGPPNNGPPNNGPPNNGPPNNGQPLLPPVQPSSPLSQIPSAPLQGLGGSFPINAPTFGGPVPGGIGIGQGVQAPFFGSNSGANVVPTSGVVTGQNYNIAGMGVGSNTGVNFGGLPGMSSLGQSLGGLGSIGSGLGGVGSGLGGVGSNLGGLSGSGLGVSQGLGLGGIPGLGSGLGVNSGFGLG